MQNFVQEGNALDLVAPSGGVTAGKLYLFGAIAAVAAITAAEGVAFAGWTEGVFELEAATHASTQAISQGGPVYWDASAGKATKTATGNTLIGVAVEDKVSTADSVKVKLMPARATAVASITDLSLAAVTGVDGTANNAASKADVDTRFASIVTKVNAIIAALDSGGVTVT